MSSSPRARDRSEDAAAQSREFKLATALANSDDLLRRLSEWDALNVPPYAGDREFWLGEIDNARTINDMALRVER